MKKILILSLLIFLVTNILLPNQETVWQKTKECLTSKPAKMTCCIIGGIAAIVIGVYFYKCIRLTRAKKCSFLMGDVWGNIDLPEIYAHFPQLDSTLEVKQSNDFFTMNISVQEKFQNDRQIMEAFKELRKAYQTAAHYNGMRKKGPQYMLSPNPDSPSLTMIRLDR